MQLTTLFFLLSTLTVRTCSTGIIAGTSKHYEVSSLVDAMVNVLKFCYANHVHTVGLAGDSPEILIKELSSRVSLSVTLLDSTARVVYNKPANRKSRYPLQVFVIAEYPTTELEPILRDIKGSLWWNHMASLFVLDMPFLSKHGCSNAFEILKTAWDMDILNAKLICLHPKKGQLMYSYNPYTGYAPVPWQLVNTYRGKNDHPWSLFAQRHRKDESICEELDFDKTNDLGGYEIRSTVKNISESWYMIPNKTGTDSFGGFSGITARILFRALNATPKLLEHTSINGFSHDKKKNDDISMDITNGNSDIGLNFRDLLAVENVTTTYPHWHGGLGALTQYSGYASEFNKIRSVIDVTSQYGVYLVILITLIFFKCFRRRTLMPAILNTLRIVCNSSLPKLPNNHSSRIYLSSLFVFAITIQVFYQGKLASMLMKRVPLPNVNTKQDLLNSGHTIYAYKLYGRFFNEPAFKGRYVSIEDLHCTPYVLRDASVACMMERQLIIDEAVELQLHLSRNTISKISFVYVIRPNWPLEQRVNKILAALTEADIIGYTSMKKYRNASNIFKFNEKLKRNEKFKVISLSELTFAFVILGIGLSCATISFIVEIAIG